MRQDSRGTATLSLSTFYSLILSRFQRLMAYRPESPDKTWLSFWRLVGKATTTRHTYLVHTARHCKTHAASLLPRHGRLIPPLSLLIVIREMSSAKLLNT
jgi:hypothetical protein